MPKLKPIKRVYITVRQAGGTKPSKTITADMTYIQAVAAVQRIAKGATK